VWLPQALSRVQSEQMQAAGPGAELVSEGFSAANPEHSVILCIRLPRALSNLTLNVPRDGASPTSLGNLGQRCITLTVKSFLYPV